MRLYILGKEIELKGQEIAQTKQANDISNVETRQTNFTNSFSIPRTAKNTRTLKDLGIIGNDSNVPYQKNEAYLYADNGECLIYNGWAVFSDTSDNFKCNIYDGNLEIYKAIENKTLADLDLTGLKHSKTLAEVISTFDNSKPYKYILADYNGKMVYNTDTINIDYLVPSVRASWLIEAIELYSGFTLNGSYRTNLDFVNLYIPYPKGTPSESTTTELYNNITGLVAGQGLTLVSGVGFTAVENLTLGYEFVTDGNYVTVNDQIVSGYLNLVIGDVVTAYRYVNAIEENVLLAEDAFLTIYKYDSIVIDFLDELKGFSIRDFLNEIVWRYGLTLFKNKYENIYTLKTVIERTDQGRSIDWSDKFNKSVGERYIFGSYAQNNWMRYKYNDPNASHNDGCYIIENKNLEDKKTVIQSKIYSPELSFSNALNFTTKIYKLWDKTPKDDGTTTYKALSNRFYFIKSVNKNFDSLSIGSETLMTTTVVTVAPVENYKGLNFQETIINNYSELQKLLNKSIVKTVSVSLKDTDIADLDLSVPYFFKQLGGSYILNKVPNYLPNKKTNIELIRINYSNEDVEFIPSHYSEEHYSSTHYST